MTANLIDLRILLDGQPAVCETRFVRAGAWILMIATTLPGPDGPVVELHSSYTGHPGIRTRSTHLQLGPERDHSAIETAEHTDDAQTENCLILFRPRELAYDHTHRLLTHLQQLGHHATAQIPEHAFTALERSAPHP